MAILLEFARAEAASFAPTKNTTMPKSSVLALLIALTAFYATDAAAASNQCSLLPPGALKQGTKYTIARKRILAAGYRISQTPYRDDGNFCKEAMQQGTQDEIQMCRKFPEIGDCSGDGYCTLWFRDSTGNKLNVTTYTSSDPGYDPISNWRLFCFGQPTRFVLWHYKKSLGSGL